MKLVLILFLICQQVLCFDLVSWTGEKSEWIEFEIKKGSHFQINIETLRGKKIAIDSLLTPRGEYLVKAQAPHTYRRLPNQLYSTLNSILRPTYIHPQIFSMSTRALEKVESGTYRLKLNSESLDNEVFLSMEGQEESESKSIRLTIKHDSTIDEQDLEESIQEAIQVYQRIGITLDVTTKEVASYAFNGQLDTTLIEESEGQKQGLILHLLPMPKGTNGERKFQGLSLCLPASFQFVFHHCALGVSYNTEVEMNRVRLGKVIAHEVGHALGLYHFDDDFYPFGRLTDRLDDTHESNHENNVMHKTSEVFGELSFTEDQVGILYKSPLIK